MELDNNNRMAAYNLVRRGGAFRGGGVYLTRGVRCAAESSQVAMLPYGGW